MSDRPIPHPVLGPKPLLGYADSRLERAAELRANRAAQDAMIADQRAGAYVIGTELIVAKKNAGAGELSQPLFTIEEARAFGPAEETVYLGHLDDAPRFGFGIPQAAAEALKARDDLLVTDLRSIAVQGLAAPEHLPPIAEAKAVLHWHARHRFCSNCGAKTDAVDAGWKRLCPVCKTEHFPRTDPVVIMLIVDGDQCLLGRSPRFAPTMWSCLAGFIEPGEAIEDAVRRETREEAGILCGRVKYYRSQPWPFPSSLMIGAHAEAKSRDIVIDATELEGARWFSKDEIVTMLARTHPDGLTTPPPSAIAHHIIRSWIEDDVHFD
ncbi:MAG: NAD(+) diphosphatase [Pseudolabrys sp.]